MAILRCSKCNRHFHKKKGGVNCIFCGSENVENIEYIETRNDESLLHYKKGCEHLLEKRYEAAKDEFHISLRYDLECSEAYWMGYLAMNEVSSDDELIYSGKFDENSSQVKNSIKYGKGVASLVYEEIININNLLLVELLKKSDIVAKQKTWDSVANNASNKLIEEAQRIYYKMKEAQHRLIQSEHNRMNMEWAIRQKYANIGYAQLEFYSEMVNKYVNKGYMELSKNANDILELSSVEKLQNTVDIKSLETMCMSCDEYNDVQREISKQADIRDEIKMCYSNLKKNKDVLLSYMKYVKEIERTTCNYVGFENKILYINIDKNQPILSNYSIIKQ